MTDNVGGIERSGGAFIMDGQKYDLDTLIMTLQLQRAENIDKQIEDQANEMKSRNQKLQMLNELMIKARGCKEDMAAADTEPFMIGTQGPKTMSQWFTEFDLTLELPASDANAEGKKATWETNISNLKGRTDSLNSSSQLDMIRLQGLMNKRNQAFEMMTNVLSKISKNRDAIIANMR